MKANQLFMPYIVRLMITGTLLILSCPLFGQDRSIDYSLNIDRSQLEINEINIDEKWMTELILEDSSFIDESGSYRLPIKFLNFMVPTFCKDITITANVNSYEEIDIPFEVLRNDKCYNTKGVSYTPDKYDDSKSIARIANEYFIDGCNHIVTVAIYPVTYESGNMSVRLMKDISLQLSYVICDENEMVQKPIFPEYKNTMINYSDIVVNPTMFHSMSKSSRAIAEKRLYYIVTSNDLKDYFNDLITWKEQKGYLVKLVTVEDIYNNPNYKIGSNQEIVDDASSLRAYLQDEYKKNGYFYCLLAGDSRKRIPVRKVLANSDITKGENSNKYIPTDNYFSDLTTKWELSQKDGDKIYSTSSSVSYYPNIYVGRLMCSNKRHIDNYIAKLLLYEANPGRGDNDYLGKTMFFEQHQITYDDWHETPGPYENWKASLIHASNAARNACDFMDITLIQDRLFTSQKTDGPTSNEIIEAMRLHGLSNWYGHGSPYGVQTSFYGHHLTTKTSVFGHIPYKKHDKRNTMGLNNLNNENHPTIVYSISCENMPYDIYERNDTTFFDSNLAEEFTVEGRHGGPAFLGNTREGWFYVNKSNSINNSLSPGLNAEFFRQLKLNKHIGVAEAISKSKAIDSKVRAAHNLIGDPEFEIWINKPKDLSVNIVENNNSITFAGSNLTGSTICIFDGKHNSDRQFYNASSNYISVPTSSGLIAYGVWKTGFLPEINLNAQNVTLGTGQYDFIVRNAKLGFNISNSKTAGNVIIGANSFLNIKAIDSIELKDGLLVKDKGKLELSCDESIAVYGAEVNSGGSITLTGSYVLIDGDFTVNKGAECLIK